MTLLEQPALFGESIAVDESAPRPTGTGSKSGRKSVAEDSPIPWRNDLDGVESLDWFTRTYLLVPRGYGAGAAMWLRPWQLEMCQGLYSDEVSLAIWVLPRGQGKSGISAAIGLHHLFNPGNAGKRIAIIAQDERSARRLLRSAARMVELNPMLAERATIYRDRIEVPGTDSEIVALPAEAHRVEGSDLDLAILDEIGFMPKDVFEAAVLSTGKFDGSKVLCIGTPSPAKFREVSPLYELVLRGRAGSDEAVSLVEYGVSDDEDIYSPATWAKANPAHESHPGGWLTDRSIRAQLPPITRESEFRRARLGQWLEGSTDPAVDLDGWKRAARPGVEIPAGAPVVLALDGSMNGDTTALLMGTISTKPHFQVMGLWEPTEDNHVSHLEVEDKIVELARRYRIVELVADPFRWQRSLQVLEEQGLPVVSFPQTTQRLTPATNDLRATVVNDGLTHADDERLNSHVLNATVQDTPRGVKIAKVNRTGRIDLLACLVMALSRAQWLASSKSRPKKQVKGYKR